MTKGKITYLLEYKYNNTKEIHDEISDFYLEDEDYKVTRIVYFEVEDDS